MEPLYSTVNRNKKVDLTVFDYFDNKNSIF